MKCKAVIADDEPIIKMDLREMFESNNYEVVGEASDGFDAVEICRETHPDLVVLDIKMPLLDGIKAAEIIKKENLARCVIILTAYCDKNLLEHAKKADVMGYIIKPVSEVAFISSIEIALAKQTEIEKIKTEYEKVKCALESRKYIDKAKGILMKTHKMTENDAYCYIRKTAMNKERTMEKIAKAIILADS